MYLFINLCIPILPIHCIWLEYSHSMFQECIPKGSFQFEYFDTTFVVQIPTIFIPRINKRQYLPSNRNRPFIRNLSWWIYGITYSCMEHSCLELMEHSILEFTYHLDVLWNMLGKLIFGTFLFGKFIACRYIGV